VEEKWEQWRLDLKGTQLFLALSLKAYMRDVKLGLNTTEVVGTRESFQQRVYCS